MPSAAQQLELLYEVNRQLATFSDLEEIERYITRHVRELFEADGAALLVLDRGRDELTFPVASQRESGARSSKALTEVRFPATAGIAGWVLHQDQATAVPDVTQDERFYSGVDAETGFATKSILCAPLRTREGNIGVLQVVNPAQGVGGAEELRFLEMLAADVGVAHEKAALYARLRDEAMSLRSLLTGAGSVLGIGGVLVWLATALTLLARALPLSELLGRPGTYAGLVAVVVGVGLLLLGRRVPRA